MLADLLRAGVKVRCVDRAFVHDGNQYPAGSFVVRVAGQPVVELADLHARLGELAAAHGVTVRSADSSWVDSGADFGSNHSLVLKVPRVMMLWDRPVNMYSAGWVRYLLEQRYGVPVTPVRTHDLSRVELDRFTVVVMPEGSGYSDVLGARGAEAIKGFVARGGVLVTFGSATRWLCEKDVGLLNSEAEPRKRPKKEEGAADKPDGKPAAEAGEQNAEGRDPAEQPKAAAEKPAEALDKPFDYAAAIRPDKESPPSVPGAILAVTIDPDHWLGFGCGASVNVVHESSNVFTPVKLDRGTNVAIYAAEDQLVRAGFVWDEAKKQLPQKAYLVHQPHGRGHVVAFAEDPNVRAFADGLNLLLLNAVLLTAGR